jgi:hypothetical protein
VVSLLTGGFEMYRFTYFVIFTIVSIYLGVWLFFAVIAFLIVVWLMLLLWNRVLSEILPLPEIGWFGGIIFTIIVIVVSTTMYGFWLVMNAPPS